MKPEAKKMGLGSLARSCRNTLITRSWYPGHTDDNPINTAQFKSNWDLNTLRAVRFMDVPLLNKNAGVPVPSISGMLDFNYSMTFTGGASFQEELMPSTVPEPTTAGCFLLGLGGLVCWQRFIKNRRSL